MYVHGTLECLLPLHTDLLISDVHTSVGCELHVLMSWLTMTNGSLLTAICLFHMLTHTHTRTHTHTHTFCTYIYVNTLTHTFVSIYMRACTTHIHQVIKNDGGALCNQYPSDIIIIKHEKMLPDTMMIRE